MLTYPEYLSINIMIFIILVIFYDCLYVDTSFLRPEQEKYYVKTLSGYISVLWSSFSNTADKTAQV